MSTTLADEARRLLDRLKAAHLPPATDAELTIAEADTRTVAWGDGKPLQRAVSATKGLCVRVIREEGQGIVTATKFTPAAVISLVDRALQLAAIAPKDTYRRFADGGQKYAPSPAHDTTLFSTPVSDRLEQLSELERRLLAIDKRLKKVVRLYFSESLNHTLLASTRGVFVGHSASSVSWVGEVLAEEGGGHEVAWDARSSRFLKDLHFEDVALEMADRALKSLGGQPLPSGSYTVLVTPRVGAQLLGLFSEALSAEAVQLGRSFLRGLKQKPVTSSQVTLVDDPFLPNGLASCQVDDEGTPHKTMTMVENGRLVDFFYDLRSANRDQVKSNGHGIKASLSTLPRPRRSNFFMKQGQAKVSDLLAAEGKVFVLDEVMGLHTADPVTGEFSLGAVGALYEKGQFSKPVRGVTIAGKIPELFLKVSAVGNDLTFFGDLGAPSFLVSKVAVGGL